ncbi:hypothetical protein DPMN_110285 [Dreissena polymorpha]|uniref:Uncharacterized protein n=1 Tax=Dreissena polymorpha TaxID=45954 RepID=A0A9D4QMZ3_DREPO|nr:hypothetical protein DPMN_110285 [Dreissena polymorpha]
MVALSPEESAQWCDRNRSQMEDMVEDENETVFTEDGSMVPLRLVKSVPASTKSHTQVLPRFERSGQIFTATKASGIAVTSQLSAPLDTSASQIFTAAKACGIAVTPQLSTPLQHLQSRIHGHYKCHSQNLHAAGIRSSELRHKPSVVSAPLASRSIAKLVEVSLSAQRSIAKLVEEISKISKQLEGIQETMQKERRSKSSGKYPSYKDAGY